jgi:hypothetical protein
MQLHRPEATTVLEGGHPGVFRVETSTEDPQVLKSVELSYSEHLKTRVHGAQFSYFTNQFNTKLFVRIANSQFVH